MVSFEGIRLKFRNNIYIPLSKNIMRKKIKNINFTIISNNCWGGTVYESYGIRKSSPTIGLFFMADDYIKFIKDLKYYLNCELEFISSENSRWKEYLKDSYNWGGYPIAKLADIEIFFLHYKNENEAYEKWKRRVGRINWEKLLIKFNDQNGCTEEHIRAFDQLHFKNKVCFTAKKYTQYASVVRVKTPKSHEFIRASYEPIGANKFLNINNMINTL